MDKPESLSVILEHARVHGDVPLGVMVYCVNEERIEFLLFPDVSWEEANAILEKFNLKVLPKKT